MKDRDWDKYMEVGIVDTSHNTADLGTKFHSKNRLVELLRMMPISIGGFEAGGAVPRPMLAVVHADCVDGGGQTGDREGNISQGYGVRSVHGIGRTSMKGQHQNTASSPRAKSREGHGP